MNLKQLATSLGLSQTTVSRALNNYPEVSEATRLRVKDAAQKANYRPNNRAKGLAIGRSMAIGHIVTISSRVEIVNPIFSDFIAGAGEVYSRNGFDMHLSIVPDIDEERTYRDLHAKGAVDGIIMHGPRENDPRIELLQDLGMPFVVHGRAGAEENNYSWVDVDNYKSFLSVTQVLADLGHKRLALINGLEPTDFALRRRAGFEDALARNDLTINPCHMASSDMTEDYGFICAQRMLAEASPPTAFVVSSIVSAIGVRRAIEQAGLKIGHDVSVAIFDDDLSYLRNVTDNGTIFTAARSSVRTAGQLCAELLIDLISSTHGQQLNNLLEPEIVMGASTGPLLH